MKIYAVIKQSMSRRENPYDNVLTENFFFVLKTESVRRLKLNSFNIATKMVDKYIYSYNYPRFQLKLKSTGVA